MKNETAADVHAAERTSTSPTFTRALRAAIRSDKLEALIRSGGPAKLRGTPTETLEEIAAAQTAAWVTGVLFVPKKNPGEGVGLARLRDAASAAIDDEALVAAAELVGVYESSELDAIRTHLTTSLALTTLEAHRFAQAENRPVDHNCVAIGGIHVPHSPNRAGLAGGPRAIGTFGRPPSDDPLAS